MTDHHGVQASWRRTILASRRCCAEPDPWQCWPCLDWLLGPSTTGGNPGALHPWTVALSTPGAVGLSPLTQGVQVTALPWSQAPTRSLSTSWVPGQRLAPSGYSGSGLAPSGYSGSVWWVLELTQEAHGGLGWSKGVNSGWAGPCE